jgi:uncharacterized protein
VDVASDIGCLQIDPIRVVEQPQYLIPWSRIGHYKHAQLDKAIYEDKTLFHFWAHAASLVPTMDYPIHQVMMRRYPSRRESVHYERFMTFLAANKALKRHILSELRTRGPMKTSDFTDLSILDYKSTGWNTDRNVDRMLDYLWTKGQIMIVGRAGQQRIWDLADRWFPEWTPKTSLTIKQQTRASIERAVKANGLAMKKHIWYYFTRWRYDDLPNTIKAMEKKGDLIPVVVPGVKGAWHLHPDDLATLEKLEQGGWKPRTTLLSPFDPLIADRGRTKLMWDFDFAIEIYVPKDKRKFGYYVLPILMGDQLIGRIDPAMDRKSGVLTINGIWAEARAPKDKVTGAVVRSTIEDLAKFLGAAKIDYNKKKIPAGWKPAFK